MRYLGGKTKLLSSIEDLVLAKAPTARDLTDLFAGSGSVSRHFRSLGFQVTTNDVLYFSYVLARGSIGLAGPPSFSTFTSHFGRDPLELLEKAAQRSVGTSSDFVLRTYSPASVPARSYLTESNALRIDAMRQELESWRNAGALSDDEYFYLLASLVAGVPSVANITGTFAAFLKSWDKRALNTFQLQPEVVVPGVPAQCHNADAVSLLASLSGSVLYLDPPYNERQYFPNYHVLETIALYDNPAVRGVTGQRANPSPSAFCSRRTAKQALVDLVEAAQFEHIVLSYNSEGLLSKDEIRDVLCDGGDSSTYTCTELAYRRYKSKVPNNAPGLVEYLFYIRKPA